MNARQKAKYYKRKYKELAEKPIPVQFKVDRYAVDTLRYARLIDEPMTHHTEYIQDILVKDICFKMAEKLKDYAEFDMRFEPHLNKYRFEATLRVVRK